MSTCQEKMKEFYHWAKINNMSFNGNKFVGLKYGNDTDIISDTTYFTDNWNATNCANNNHMDSGIYMSDTG